MRQSDPPRDYLNGSTNQHLGILAFVKEDHENQTFFTQYLAKPNFRATALYKFTDPYSTIPALGKSRSIITSDERSYTHDLHSTRSIWLLILVYFKADE